MSIRFDADQATYDAWYAALVARANDPSDDLFMADVMDANMIFGLAHELGRLHPGLVPKLREHTPAAVDAAMTKLGLFMGARNLATLVGASPDEAQKLVFVLMGGSR
jgi:hypothetical protein